MQFKLWLVETVSVVIKDYTTRDSPENIHSLSIDVKEKLRGIPEFNQGTNPEGFGIDGYNTEAKEGILNFYPQGMPDQAIPKILKAIKYYLGEFGATFGEFKEDLSNLFRGEKVYRIPVRIQRQNTNKPPQINMANKVARIIFNQILNYPSDTHTIQVNDLLFKLSMANDFNIKQATKEPIQQTGKVKVLEGEIDEERIRRHLQGLHELSQWAIQNHYDTLELV